MQIFPALSPVFTIFWTLFSLSSVFLYFPSLLPKHLDKHIGVKSCEVR